MLSGEEVKLLRRLLSRALNKNQRIILSQIDKDFVSLNSLSEFLNENFSIPKSTAKLNIKILCQLGIVKVNSASKLSLPSLTPFGKKIKEILEGGENNGKGSYNKRG